MSIRDVQADFTSGAGSASTSIVGAGGTYLAPNSIDTGPLAGFLTELTVQDTQLSANVNTGRDLGGGERLWLVIDWIQAPAGGTSIDMQLLTSASVALSSPIVLLDTGIVPIASFSKGFRQIYALPRTGAYLEWLGLQAITVGTFTAGAYVAWLGKDIDSVVQGYASGYSLK